MESVALSGAEMLRAPQTVPARALLFLADLLDRLGAAILLLAILPLLVPVAAAVLITSGRPVFYRGTRLGRHRRPFLMYKFRTLVNGAEAVVGGRMLTRQDNLTTPIGWFLRDSRLDELPQILNVLKGDMRFVGPRPERPEVYESLCRDVPGYEARFEAKPGLIGYAQLFTPHNTPKRIRALIDRRVVSRGPRPLADLMLIAYTALVVAATSLRRLLRSAWRDVLLWRLLRRRAERRRLARLQPRRAAAIVSHNGSGVCCCAPVLDISDSAFVMICGERLAEPLPESFRLVMRHGRNGNTRRWSALCRGSVSQVRPTPRGYEYVVDFEPADDRSLYVVHQHFLRRSLAPT